MMKGIMMLSLFLLTSIGMNAQEIEWLTWEEVAVKMEDEPRKIMVDVYTEWCGWCKKMDASTFKNPEVIDYINTNYYAVKFDAEYKKPIVLNGVEYNFIKAGRNGYHELAAKILRGKLSYPSLVFLNENMKVIQPISGFRDKNTLMMILEYFHDDFHKTTLWQTYVKNYEKKTIIQNDPNDNLPVQTVGNNH